MAEQRAEQASEALLRMVVTRADGTIHDHGIVSAHYKSPIKQAWWRLIGKPLADRRIRRSNRTPERG